MSEELTLMMILKKKLKNVQAKQQVDRIDGAKAAELTQKVGKHASAIQLKGSLPPESAAEKSEVMKQQPFFIFFFRSVCVLSLIHI